MALGFLIGALIAGLVAFAIGICHGIDMMCGPRRDERLDITPAIARARRAAKGRR